MNYKCKVCGYDQMPYPPSNYNICPCCGTEYGVDDAFDSYEYLRDEWLTVGAPWFSKVEPYLRPAIWDGWTQLDLACLKYNVPRPSSGVDTEITTAKIPDGFELMSVLRLNADWSQA